MYTLPKIYELQELWDIMTSEWWQLLDEIWLGAICQIKYGRPHLKADRSREQETLKKMPSDKPTWQIMRYDKWQIHH